MTQEEMAKKILEVVDHSGDPTILEIVNALGPEARGDREFLLADLNVALWSGVSKLFCDALASLRPALEMKHAHILCFALDGGMLNYPLASPKCSKPYKDTHWLPVRFVRRKWASADTASPA